MNSEPTAFEIERGVTVSVSPFGKINGVPIIYKGVVKMENRGYLNHYFHFMEVFLGCFCWAEGNIDILNCQSSVLNNTLINSLVEAVVPGVKINIRNFSTDIYVIGDRDKYPKSQLKVRINKILDSSVSQCKLWYPKFVGNVYSNLYIKPKNKPQKVEDITITYILRENPSNKRELVDKDKLFDVIRKSGSKLQIVKFEEISFKNQVQLVANTDILIGVHGNGLTNLLWLPNHGCVIELFDSSFHHYDYQIFSEIGNKNYVGIGKDVFTNGSRLGEAYGHTRRPVNIDLQTFKNQLANINKKLLFK